MEREPISSVYITFDELIPTSGAGLVCLHEIEALKKVSDEISIFERKNNYGGLYEFNPFLYDYFGAEMYNGKSPDILHLSCSPGNRILEVLKPKHYVVNIVAHELKTSIDEHELYYGKGSYQFVHNTNEYLHKRLLNHAKNASMILTPSSTSADWIRKNIREDRITIIPHGTEIPITVSKFPEKFTIGYLGAAGPDKGLPYLHHAYQLMPSYETTSMLYGGNCGNFMKQFDGAKILGWVKDISEFYNQISVYVQPSVTEGFGIEIIEAMAYGRPVIASRGAGGADAITDGYDGFVVPAKDVNAMMIRLQWFKENPEMMKEMGLRARDKAKESEWCKIEDKYERMYSEVLNVK
jgi:glycosyltransferase involved in cell wall biosynthesis